MFATAALLFVVTIMLLRGHLYNNFFIMASHLLVDYAVLLVAITFSLLLRLRYNQMRHGFGVYMPMLVLGLVIILFRIVFIPNSVVNLVFPPIVLFFLVWQWRAVRRHSGKLRESEIIAADAEQQAEADDDETDDDDGVVIEVNEAEERRRD